MKFKMIQVSISRILILLFFVVSSTFFSLFALDLPVFYRAPYFQNTFEKDEAKYTTQFSFKYMHGQTHKTWDDGNNKVSLFSGYGYADITKLGLNYENPTQEIKAYWFDQNAPFNPAVYKSKTNPMDGLIDFNGKFEMDEFAILIQQDLFWGLFVQVYVPLRDIRLKGITYKNLGADKIGGANNDAVNVEDFMQNQLNPILKSVGVNDYKKSYSDSGVSEVLISAGWHKWSKIASPIIKTISGSAQVGALIPACGEKTQDVAFSIPLGYDNFYGANFRANIFVGIFDWAGVGGSAGGSLLFSEKRNIRVKTDYQQAGWIQLQKAYIDVETGSEWDFEGYVQLGPVYGLSCMVGYSYARQESTHYTNKDANFLKTYSEDKLNQKPWDQDYPDQIFPYVVSKDGILNSDQKLRAWDIHTLHLVAKYEVECNKFDPSIQFEYNYPFYGINSWPTDTWGGTANLMIKFKF